MRKIFAERLKKAREDARLSMAKLAEKIGVASPMIHQYEHGQSIPSLDRLPELANSLGVSSSWLIGESSDPEPIMPSNSNESAQDSIKLAQLKLNEASRELEEARKKLEEEQKQQAPPPQLQAVPDTHSIEYWRERAREEIGDEVIAAYGGDANFGDVVEAKAHHMMEEAMEAGR